MQNYFLPFLEISHLFAIIYLLPRSAQFTLWFNSTSRLKNLKEVFTSSLYQISIWQINFISDRRDARNSMINFTRDSFLQRRKICRERAKKKYENRKSEMKTQHAIVSTYINTINKKKKREMKSVFRVIKDLILKKKIISVISEQIVHRTDDDNLCILCNDKRRDERSCVLDKI